MEYDAATSKFSEAVSELHRRMGTSPKEEYDRVKRASNQARVRSEQARLALEQHIDADVVINETLSLNELMGS